MSENNKITWKEFTTEFNQLLKVFHGRMALEFLNDDLFSDFFYFRERVKWNDYQSYEICKFCLLQGNYTLINSSYSSSAFRKYNINFICTSHKTEEVLAYFN